MPPRASGEPGWAVPGWTVPDPAVGLHRFAQSYPRSPPPKERESSMIARDSTASRGASGVAARQTVIDGAARELEGSSISELTEDHGGTRGAQASDVRP